MSSPERTASYLVAFLKRPAGLPQLRTTSLIGAVECNVVDATLGDEPCLVSLLETFIRSSLASEPLNPSRSQLLEQAHLPQPDSHGERVGEVSSNHVDL